MPENPDPAAATVLSLITQLSKDEWDKLMRLLESVPVNKLAGCVVVPVTVFELMRAWSATLSSMVRRVLAVVDDLGKKLGTYRRGPRKARKKREGRDGWIAMALASAMTDPQEIRRFIIDQAPETVLKHDGTLIDAGRMMRRYHDVHRAELQLSAVDALFHQL